MKIIKKSGSKKKDLENLQNNIHLLKKKKKQNSFLIAKEDIKNIENMSLREYYAGLFTQALIFNYTNDLNEDMYNLKIAVENAVVFTDVLIAKLNSTKQT